VLSVTKRHHVHRSAKMASNESEERPGKATTGRTIDAHDKEDRVGSAKKSIQDTGASSHSRARVSQQGLRQRVPHTRGIARVVVRQKKKPREISVSTEDEEEEKEEEEQGENIDSSSSEGTTGTTRVGRFHLVAGKSPALQRNPQTPHTRGVARVVDRQKRRLEELASSSTVGVEELTSSSTVGVEESASSSAEDVEELLISSTEGAEEEEEEEYGANSDGDYASEPDFRPQRPCLRSRPKHCSQKHDEEIDEKVESSDNDKENSDAELALSSTFGARWWAKKSYSHTRRIARPINRAKAAPGLHARVSLYFTLELPM